MTGIEDYAREKTEIEIRKAIFGMSNEQKRAYLTSVADIIRGMMEESAKVNYIEDDGHYPDSALQEQEYIKKRPYTTEGD